MKLHHCSYISMSFLQHILVTLCEKDILLDRFLLNFSILYSRKQREELEHLVLQDILYIMHLRDQLDILFWTWWTHWNPW